MYWVDDEQPEEFDFTFDCPVCVVQSGGCGFLALNNRFCLWTDRDAAETYLERAADTLPDNPSGDTLDVVEIESDSDLLDLLMRTRRGSGGNRSRSGKARSDVRAVPICRERTGHTP